jgi:ribosome-associated heat shock protein Hsp15
LQSTSTVRLDKWLWAARLFKTRSAAAAACTGGKVLVNGNPAKPARPVRENDTIVAKTGEITRTVKVLKAIDKRVGAALVPELLDDLTPASEYEKKRERSLRPVVFDVRLARKQKELWRGE